MNEEDQGNDEFAEHPFILKPQEWQSGSYQRVDDVVALNQQAGILMVSTIDLHAERPKYRAMNEIRPSELLERSIDVRTKNVEQVSHCLLIAVLKL